MKNVLRSPDEGNPLPLAKSVAAGKEPDPITPPGNGVVNAGKVSGVIIVPPNLRRPKP